MILLVKSSQHAAWTTDFIVPCCMTGSSSIALPEPLQYSMTGASLRVDLVVHTHPRLWTVLWTGVSGV